MRDRDSASYNFISPDELFAHFAAIQAKGLSVLAGNQPVELDPAAGT